MVWLAIAVAGAWLWIAWRDALAVRAYPELPPLAANAAATPPEVTAVVAVRDGADSVLACVDSLLAQQHVALTLIVVDDRSRDATPQLLAARAAHEPRLQVRTVRDLPPGWLGKTHALAQGAADVASEWLLLIDADAAMTATTLARAIAAARDTAADHVALVPDHRGASLLGQACLLGFHQVVQHRVRVVNRTPQRTFVGAGAFNLVRTAAYRRIGGHTNLALEVVDDVCLGLLLYRAGCRSRAFAAPRDLAVDWGATPLAMLRVVEKNMFAVLRFRTLLSIAVLTVVLAHWLLTFTAPWWAGPFGWVPIAACLADAPPAMALARKMGWPLRAGALVPLARFWLWLALLRSTAMTLWRRGVRWRDTFYPLADLRRAMVR